MLVGTFKAGFQAMKSMQLQGNIKQQGGQFVLGPGKVMHMYIMYMYHTSSLAYIYGFYTANCQETN